VQLGAVNDQLNTPVICADGYLYVGSANGSKSYYCLDAADGHVIWSRAGTHGGGYYWAGACAIGDYLIYGDDAGWLTSVNKESGVLADEEELAVVWTGASEIRSAVSYSAATGRVYFTDQGGCCWAYGFDAATGDLSYQWHRYIGWSTSTPAVAGDRVYVGHGSYSSGGAMHCLEEADGSTDWTFTVPNGGGVQSSPAVSIAGGDTRIYFTANCASGAAYGLDGSGNQLWEFVTEESGAEDGYVLQGVAVSDGCLYFGNDGGYLYALGNALPAWDVNGDGVVNVLDMVLVRLQLGETGSPGWIPEDVTADGTINILDLVRVRLHIGE
jgi:outer membrane protein assembly factor BamB